MCACQCAEHLSTLLNSESFLAEVGEFLMVGRDGWCVDHETRLLLSAGVWYLVDVLLVVDEHSLALKLLCKCRRCFVVSGYNESFA